MQRARFRHAFAMLIVLSGAPAFAEPRIDLGVMDGIALDQPRVTFGLRDPANPGVIVGPGPFSNTAALDTGADSVLLAAFGYLDDNFEVDPNLYQLEHRADSSVVQYAQTGIGGTVLYDVTIPYNLEYFGPNGGASNFLTGVRVTGSPNEDLSDLAGIVGMPAMVGRVMNWDLTPMVNFDLIDATFAATAPAPTAHSYHIHLDQFATEASGQQQPDDPLPVLANLPLVPGVTTGFGALATSGRFLLDSGASTTLISRATALSLGIDPDTDAIDQMPVGGVGGETTLPVVHVDSITLPTAEGVNLVYHDIDVAVIDIEGLDVAGILGFNALTTGYLDALLSGEPGAFENVVLDLTDPAHWDLRLDLNPSFDHVIDPPFAGDANNDGVVDISDLVLLARFFDTDHTTWTGGDFNHDGVTDISDLVLLAAHFGLEAPWATTASLTAATSPIPEPGTLALLIPLAVLLRMRARQARAD
ncbi:MAG: hypothetical protein GC162_19015 [Planctomycetes bacterium]|nr:hypothetical protein [Planctomycetota bacterium]